MAFKLLMSVFAVAIAGGATQSATIVAKVVGNYTLAGFASVSEAQSFITPATVSALNTGFCGRYCFSPSLCGTKLVIVDKSRRLSKFSARLRRLPPKYNVQMIVNYTVNVPMYSGYSCRSPQSPVGVQADLAKLPAWVMTAVISMWLQNSKQVPPSFLIIDAGTPVVTAVATTDYAITSLAPLLYTTTTLLPSTTPWIPWTTIQGSYGLSLSSQAPSTDAMILTTFPGGKTGIMNALIQAADPYRVQVDKFSVNVTFNATTQTPPVLYPHVVVNYVIGLPAWAPSWSIPENFIPFLTRNLGWSGLTGTLTSCLRASMGNAAPYVSSVFVLTKPQVYVNGVLVTETSTTPQADGNWRITTAGPTTALAETTSRSQVIVKGETTTLGPSSFTETTTATETRRSPVDLNSTTAKGSPETTRPPDVFLMGLVSTARASTSAERTTSPVDVNSTTAKTSTEFLMGLVLAGGSTTTETTSTGTSTIIDRFRPVGPLIVSAGSGKGAWSLLRLVAAVVSTSVTL